MKIILLSLYFVLFISNTSLALTVALKTWNGRYVVAEGAGGAELNANRAAIGPWEQFRIFDLNEGRLLSKDRICIMTNNGHYVVAEGGGGGDVNANRPHCGPWEEFQIIKVDQQGFVLSGTISHNDYIALRASSGHYVVAEGGGGGVVNANRSAIGPWEIFQIKFL